MAQQQQRYNSRMNKHQTINLDNESHNHTMHKSARLIGGSTTKKAYSNEFDPPDFSSNSQRKNTGRKSNTSLFHPEKSSVQKAGQTNNAANNRTSGFFGNFFSTKKSANEKSAVTASRDE